MTQKRIYQCELQWYFNTRGDSTCGPFASAEEAERNLKIFVKDCKNGTLLHFDWSSIRLFRRPKPNLQQS